MKAIIGIDVGGSTTKIVGFGEGGRLIDPMSVKANDPITAVYGAFGKFTDENRLDLKNIERIAVTGVGSTYLTTAAVRDRMPARPGIRLHRAAGGLYLSGLDSAIVVSMGTGTAIVKAERGKPVEYLGGTGIGGGTLIGLSKKMIGVTDIGSIMELASAGDLRNVDLRVCDITRKDIPGMSSKLTAANFGNLSDLASKNDLALGLVNMIFESVAMLALFAARDRRSERSS